MAIFAHTRYTMHQMIQGECKKCNDVGEQHGTRCIVRQLIFDRDFKSRKPHVTRQQALEAAVSAIQSFIDRDKKPCMACEIIPFNELRGRKMNQQVQQLPVQEQRQVVVQQNQPYYPSEADWRHMLSWGEAAIKSGMLPHSIKTKEAAAMIVLKGRELGMPFMVAIAHIHIINGKASSSAEIMQATAMKNIPGLVINVLKMASDGATVEIIRPERGQKPFVFSFDLEDAKRAQVLHKDTWKSYPKAMYLARAMSAALRAKCADGLNGVSYTPEELGASVDVDGNVIETTSRALPDDEKPEEPPIVVGNVVVPSPAKPEEPKVVHPPLVGSGPTKAQLRRLFDIAKTKGMTSKDEIKNWIGCTFDFREDFSLTELTTQEYKDICNAMLKLPVPETQPEIDVNDQAHPESFEIQHTPEPAKQAAEAKPLPWAKYREDPRMVK